MESMPQKYAEIVKSEKIVIMKGVFTADQLISAGAEKVIPDLKDADGILQMLLKTNLQCRNSTGHHGGFVGQVSICCILGRYRCDYPCAHRRNTRLSANPPDA